MLSNRIGKFITVLTTLGLVIAFQNCSNLTAGLTAGEQLGLTPLSSGGRSIAAIGGAGSDGMTAPLTGGSGSDGMSFVALDMVGTCPDGDLAKSRIIFPAGGHQYELVRLNCKLVNPPLPVDITVSGIDVIYQAEIYQPEWMTMSADNSPIGRFNHSSVWTGSEMIVWGGFTTHGFTTSATAVSLAGFGGAYNPSANAWRLLPIKAAPAQRGAHVAVWTGSKMFVWGGYDATSTTYFSDGGLYDPATNEWSPVSSVMAPAARINATAVWTGSKVLIWGGQDANHASLADGAAYDPLTDTWTQLSMKNAPSARYNHTAVWTGSAMIVWGGIESVAHASGSGAVYNPLTDSWSGVSFEGAPLARYSHTAVWTGSQMIIWGGRTSTVGGSWCYGAGAALDPVANTWTKIPDLDGPTPRYQHSAVWTGSKMIIWGGVLVWQQFEHLAPPAATYFFDPASQQWKILSPSGITPLARYGHSAVWDGNEMVVWGGVTSTDPKVQRSLVLGAGGRLKSLF